MEELLAAIAIWLSANFPLPATFDYPRIAFVQAAELPALRQKGSASVRKPEAAGRDQIEFVEPEQIRQVLAVYNDQDMTIYLPDTWTGQTPAEQSMLVHEMVHHLQNVAHLKYECPQEREKMAYAAQSLWLERFGRNLETEFDIDPLALLLTTQCLIWPP